jgi:hypothetical protein
VFTLITIAILGMAFLVVAMAVHRRVKQPGGDQSTVGSHDPISTPALQMETLLDDIRNATDLLLTALADEEAARAGSLSLRNHGESEAEQIARMRIDSEKTQREYYEAVERYRLFVGSLALPLQQDAVQRGLEVMNLAPVLGSYVLTVPSLRDQRDQRTLVACH